MDNEQLDRDHEEHRDWLEGQASDQLEREEFERAGGFRNRGIDITLPDGRTLIFERISDAVMAGHAILSAVEAELRGDADG